MGVKSIRMIRAGEHGEVPGPELFWMRDFEAWYPLHFYVVVIETEKGYVLINTGLVRDLERRNQFLKQWAGGGRCRFSSFGELPDLLRPLQIPPDRVTDVLTTPVQDYTLGGLPYLKRATIHFSRRGWYNDVVSPGVAPFLDREIYFPRYIREYLFEEAWDRISLVEDQEVLQGVSVKWTGCHHRSSMAVMVDSPIGRYCFTDAAFVWRNLQDNLPIGIAEDIYECLDSYKYLKEVCPKVVPAYDPDNPIRFPELF